VSKARELAQKPNQPTGRKNLIINGAMNVAQRGTQTGHASGYTLDRWNVYTSSAARFTVSQDSHVPSGQGFANSIKLDVTTADTSLDAADFGVFRTLFEGQDLQHICKGTSNAKKLTLQFWIKSTVTGTYALELYDSDNVRQVTKNYTVNSADTWEKKIITFPADTTGIFSNDNAVSLYVQFGIIAGSNFTSGVASGSWASRTEANRYVGQVNAANSTSNNIYFTGVQLEVGSVATEFEHRSFGEELALCQRYYHQQERTSSPVEGVYIGIGQVNQTTQALAIYTLPVSMRTIPTLAHGTVGAGATSNYTGTLSAFYADNLHFSFYFVSSGMVVGDVIRIYNSGPGEKVTFDAEL